MFNGHNEATIAHECLHAQKLPHTFACAEKFTYQARETENIMDYSHHTIDNVAYYNLTDTQKIDPVEIAKIQRTPKDRYLLWYWQWKKANTNIK
jgi:hypothetical protein